MIETWKQIATAPRDDTLFVVGWYNGKNQWCADVWSGRYLAAEDKKRAEGFYKNSPHLDCDPDYWFDLPPAVDE